MSLILGAWEGLVQSCGQNGAPPGGHGFPPAAICVLFSTHTSVIAPSAPAHPLGFLTKGLCCSLREETDEQPGS